MSRWAIQDGDALEVLTRMPRESVQCIVTSPPYWRLRRYDAHAGLIGGDVNCDHSFRPGLPSTCEWCGGYVGQLGSESDPRQFVGHLAGVFDQARRVLRPDGVCFVVMGDGYWPGSKGKGGIKPKDLVGVPFMLAEEMRARGWYWRDLIVWAKGVSFREEYSGSTMPESVSDRCTQSHEYVLMMTRSESYHLDMGAVRERGTVPAGTVAAYGSGEREGNRIGESGGVTYSGTRNLRDVWAISARGFTGKYCRKCDSYREGLEGDSCPSCGSAGLLSHHATFPRELVRPMLQMAGRPGGLVLDPFSGAGTVVMVAQELDLDALGIEAGEGYAALSRARIRADAPLLNVSGETDAAELLGRESE